MTQDMNSNYCQSTVGKQSVCLSTTEDTNASNCVFKRSDDNGSNSFEIVDKENIRENIVILSNPVNSNTLRHNRLADITDKRRYYQSQNKHQNANPLHKSSEFTGTMAGKRFMLPTIQTSRKFAHSNMQNENKVPTNRTSLEQDNVAGSITQRSGQNNLPTRNISNVMKLH